MLYNSFSIDQITDTNNERRVHKLLYLPDFSVQKFMDYVTPNEIKLIVKNLLNKNASGLVLMTSLFNFLLRVGHFPLNWRLATVILIKKTW
jgi:hypothetical protein